MFYMASLLQFRFVSAKCFKKLFINEFGETELRAGCLGSAKDQIDQCNVSKISTCVCCLIFAVSFSILEFSFLIFEYIAYVLFAFWFSKNSFIFLRLSCFALVRFQVRLVDFNDF